MIIGVITDVGLVRKDNQDSYYVSKDLELPLYILADGMGGHNAGNIASNMAVNIIKDVFLSNRDILDTKDNVISTIKKSIRDANHNIYKKSLTRDQYSGMGTTVTLAYILDRTIYIGHVGDSRAYYIDDKNIEQITEDHSLVNELIKKGNITEAEARDHPKKSTITRAVGTSNDVKVDIYKKEYIKDHNLLICSDGLTDMIKDEKILEIINGEGDIIVKSKNLVGSANDKGGLDNITVILLKF